MSILYATAFKIPVKYFFFNLSEKTLLSKSMYSLVDSFYPVWKTIWSFLDECCAAL